MTIEQRFWDSYNWDRGEYGPGVEGCISAYRWELEYSFNMGDEDLQISRNLDNSILLRRLIPVRPE